MFERLYDFAPLDSRSIVKAVATGLSMAWLRRHTSTIAQIDMLVGDIYGNRDYSAIGLSANTIASSFGRVVSEDLDLPDVQPADVAMALCRMVSYNIAHLSYLNAKRYDLPRIFFGGCVRFPQLLAPCQEGYLDSASRAHVDSSAVAPSEGVDFHKLTSAAISMGYQTNTLACRFFIRGHSYTMDTISFAIRFWSKVRWLQNLPDWHFCNALLPRIHVVRISSRVEARAWYTFPR